MAFPQVQEVICSGIFRRGKLKKRKPISRSGKEGRRSGLVSQGIGEKRGFGQ